MQLRSRIMVTAAALNRMRFRRIAAVTAAVALMMGLGTASAVAQPVTGRAPAQSCASPTGYLVDATLGLGARLASHNVVDTVAGYPNGPVTLMKFICVGVDAAGSPIYVIGASGLCLDEGSASLENLVYSEGCNESLTTERWIAIGGSGDFTRLENNHFGNCLSSGGAAGDTLGGRSCSPTLLNEWAVAV